MSSKAKKYEKKLNKALKKLKGDAENEELQHKVEKYRKKIGSAAGSNDDEDDSDSDASAAAPVTAKKTSAPAVAPAKEVAADTSGVTILLFYAYVEPPWSPSQHADALRWTEGLLARLECTGRLRVAREGFNGTLTGSYHGIREFTRELRKYDNGKFAHMNDKDDFKYKDNLPQGQKFPRLKVFAVKELVNYGLGVDDAPSVHQGGHHLDPSDYHNKLHEDNTVVIDVRNSYEADIGRFAPATGAEYIDPKMRVSTEFPGWVKDNFEKIKDKQVLMYCTGGIRCERASALVRSLGHEKVFQLKGGIHNYLEEFADKGGGCWVGDNYTFDKRFLHGAKKPAATDATADAAPTAEGKGSAATPATAAAEAAPVASSSSGASSSGAGSNAPGSDIVGQCAGCCKPWNKYRGRKRCPVCGVPLLLCFDCLKGNAYEALGAKCALCKEDARLGRKPFNKREHKVSTNECGDGEEDDEEGGSSSGGAAGGKRSAGAMKGAAISCGMCQEVFKSRNALFKHIKETGHANRKAKKQKSGP